MQMHYANDAKTFLRHFSDCLFYFCSTFTDSMHKGRHFSLLRHLQHRIKHRSRHVNQTITQIHFRQFPLPVSFQNNANTLHTSHIVLLHCYLFILANTMSKSPFSQCNLVSRKRALRSIPNLQHWKGLLLAVSTEYKVDRIWIRGSGVIGSQSPTILRVS